MISEREIFTLKVYMEINLEIVSSKKRVSGEDLLRYLSERLSKPSSSLRTLLNLAKG